MRIAPTLSLTPEERQQLESWARGRSTPHRLVLRAQIILRAAEGVQNQQIAEELDTPNRTPVPSSVTDSTDFDFRASIRMLHARGALSASRMRPFVPSCTTLCTRSHPMPPTGPPD